MRSEVLQEIRQLVAERKLIEAIKGVRAETGLGLKEAKEAVEALQRGETPPGFLESGGAPQRRGLTPRELQQIKAFAEEGKTIEAIKLVRATTKLGLKEAKTAVEALQRGQPVPGLSAEIEASLPARCPDCGATIGQANIKWVTALTAECLYCGGSLRAV